MSDIFTKSKRSEIMSRIRGKDTQPEMRVRSLVHALGYRYRLHGKSLTGHPDLVLSSRRKVIFVHGCFWHRHTCSRGLSLPATNRTFWRTKLQRNVARDRRVVSQLRKEGWDVMTVWECQTTPVRLASLRWRIIRFLVAPGPIGPRCPINRRRTP